MVGATGNFGHRSPCAIFVFSRFAPLSQSPRLSPPLIDPSLAHFVGLRFRTQWYHRRPPLLWVSIPFPPLIPLSYLSSPKERLGRPAHEKSRTMSCLSYISPTFSCSGRPRIEIMSGLRIIFVHAFITFCAIGDYHRPSSSSWKRTTSYSPGPPSLPY